jgi:hypothetical protein
MNFLGPPCSTVTSIVIIMTHYMLSVCCICCWEDAWRLPTPYVTGMNQRCVWDVSSRKRPTNFLTDYCIKGFSKWVWPYLVCLTIWDYHTFLSQACHVLQSVMCWSPLYQTCHITNHQARVTFCTRLCYGYSWMCFIISWCNTAWITVKQRESLCISMLGSVLVFYMLCSMT